MIADFVQKLPETNIKDMTCVLVFVCSVTLALVTSLKAYACKIQNMQERFYWPMFIEPFLYLLILFILAVRNKDYNTATLI